MRAGFSVSSNVLVRTYPLAAAKINSIVVPNEGEAFARPHERRLSPSGLVPTIADE